MALALATIGTAAQAKDPPREPADAKEAADRFSLDLAPAENGAVPAAPADAAPDSAARFGLDTPIAQLLANFRSKAVLDRDLPGLSTDKNLDKFKALSLRKLAPASGGRLSPELLEKVGKHLAEIG